MATVKVYRYDADTGKALSTFVRVGKYGTDKADKEDTATVSEFPLPYLTKPNGNLYAIEIYNPNGYSFARIEGNTSFTRGGDIWYKFPITSANAVINIRLYFKSTTTYYTVGVSSNISEGSGKFGAYGDSTYDKYWSGTSRTTKSIPAGKRIAVEVYNVNNYDIDSVDGCSYEGSLSDGSGLYFLSNSNLTSNVNFYVRYRSLLHTLYARTSTGGSIRTVYDGTTYVDNRDITVKEGNSFTMTATPDTTNHYKFLYWLKDNVLYSYNATITPTMGNSSVTYQAIFQQSSSHTVKVEPKPPLTNYGGDIYINGVKTHSATFYEDTGIRLEWNAVTTTRRFDYWEYTIGGVVNQNDNRVATITGITSDITIYVQWHEVKQNITAIPTPYAGGYVQITNVTKNTSAQSSGSNKASLDWENGDNVVIDYVITGEGYRFNYWDITNRTYDSSGVPTRHYTSTKFQLPMTDYPFDDYDVRCNLQEQYTIRVARNQPWGTAYLLLQDGTHTDEFTYFPTEIVTMVAEPNEGYKFDGWTGGDGVDTSGLDLTQSTLSFTIESKREGTWIANFSVEPIAIGVRDNIDNTHAYAVVNGKHYSNWLYTYGANVYIYAEEVVGYKFVKWETTAEASIDYTSRVLNFTASTSYGGYYTAIYESTIPVVDNITIPIIWQLLFRKRKTYKKVYIKR